MKVYLGGAVHDSSQEEIHSWREFLKEQLRAIEIEWFDPTMELIRYPVERDLQELQGCDVMIANLWKHSPGTYMEMFYMYRILGRPVVIYLMALVDYAPSPWVTENSTYIVYSPKEV